MNTGDFKASMDRYILDKFKMLNTIKPGIVTGVNGSSVKVKPLTTTKFRDGTHIASPELFDVPLLQIATKHASIELPVSVGDLVIVLCSDRDYSDLLDRDVRGPDIAFAEEPNSLGLFPLLAIPVKYALASSRPNPSNLTIKCKGTTMTVGENGVVVDGVITAKDVVTDDVPSLNDFYNYSLTHIHNEGTPTQTTPPAPPPGA